MVISDSNFLRLAYVLEILVLISYCLGGRSDHILAIGRVRVNKEVAGFQFKSSFAAALFMCQHGKKAHV